MCVCHFSITKADRVVHNVTYILVLIYIIFRELLQLSYCRNFDAWVSQKIENSSVAALTLHTVISIYDPWSQFVAEHAERRVRAYTDVCVCQPDQIAPIREHR